MIDKIKVRTRSTAAIGVFAFNLVLVGCEAGPAPAERAPAAAAKVETAAPAPPGATAETAGACAEATREGGALRWFHDDYPAALACARSKSLPLMIDMWAPWCHTCLSMQAYVLTDERLADYDRRFVFLGLDTDREANAEVVAKFPPAAWPTFFAVSSTDESIQSRFVGAATVEQFAQFLEDGERGHQAAQGGQLAAHEAAAREGDRAASDKRWSEAMQAYERALTAAPRDWPRGADVMVSLLAAHVKGKQWAVCPAVVRAYLDRTGKAASATDFGAHALQCAREQSDPATAAALRESVVARLRGLVDDAAAPMSVDDRSDALLYLREGLDALARPDDARAAATQQRRLLDEAAVKTTAPRIAMTYNWPRAEVYTYLGVGLELVPALEQSVKDLPAEYDPPYRLAWIHLQAGKTEQAQRWAEQAITLAYGPRKAKAQAMLAEIHHARADVDGERAARTAALATLQGLPLPAQNPDAIAKAKAELDAVGKAK